VGFIRDLPHALVEAFKATLEEVRDADLLLNVVDISDKAAAEQQQHVLVVLRELQAQSVPSIKVFNKVDLLGPGDSGGTESLSDTGENEGPVQGFRVSAHTGEGLEALRKGIAVALGAASEPLQIELGPGLGRLRAWLHELAAVRAECVTEAGGWQLSVRIDAAGQRRLAAEGVVMSRASRG
jgi:GTP-binding protein HflX